MAQVLDRALCPVLVGRAPQLEALEDALLAADRGEGQVVILAGEAGMGKTRLAEELQSAARRAGTVVMEGSCSEAELALPYLPFLEAIGNYLAIADLDALRERLGVFRRELAQLFPQMDPEASHGDGGDPTQGRLRLFEALLALLRIPADEDGVLLIVEDIHWADASTRELLDYMTRRLRTTRIMVLATYRSDELHRRHPLLPLVQGWRRSGTARIVELEHLTPDGIADMVRAIFDTEEVSDEFRDFLFERSEGTTEVVATVMFLDVRGYTEQTALRAPQDTVDRLSSLHRWAKTEVERHHGTVDKFAGDAVMAVFNASGARLDHAVHALQAALAIRDKAAYAGMPVGIGLATGPAVVGQLTEGANVSAVGESTNLAARLQSSAAAGEILVSDETYRRVKGWLTTRGLDARADDLELKGFDRPISAFRLG